jgi:hypothetical protein
MSKKITPKGWKEFRDTGLLLFINSFLNIFGWAIVIKIPDEGDGPWSGYPARVTFRGFKEESYTKSYIKLSKFMAENASELNQEANL